MEVVVLGGIRSDMGDYSPVLIVREHRHRTDNPIRLDRLSANKCVGNLATVSRQAPILRICFGYEM